MSLAPAPTNTPCIGVFDSGIGGLSVLRALRAALPQVPMVYAADSAFAPYGERGEAYVLARSRVMTQYLMGRGAALVVNACNTATALAAPALRAEFAALPMVGIEPAIKPAALISRSGKVGVMATRGTLESAKFAALLRQVQSLHPQVVFTLHACDGLAAAVENLSNSTVERREIVRLASERMVQAGCDTVVLGCTHYPLIADEIKAALVAAQLKHGLTDPTAAQLIELVDPAHAVAAQTAKLWRETATNQGEVAYGSGSYSSDNSKKNTPAALEFYSTCDLRQLEAAARVFL